MVWMLISRQAFTHLVVVCLFQNVLLMAVEQYNEQLTAEEKERNQQSLCLSYTYDGQVQPVTPTVQAVRIFESFHLL